MRRSIVVLLVFLAPTRASADLVKTTFQCRGSAAKVVVTTNCEPGDTVLVNYRCGGTEILQNSVRCPSQPRRRSSIEEEASGRFLVADWALGARFRYVNASADGGSSIGGTELYLMVKLQMVEDLLALEFDLGPGIGSDGDDNMPTLTESFGLNVRLANWFSVALAARHWVAFDGVGDHINSLMCSLRLSFMLWRNLEFQLEGGYGEAWFPVLETQAALRSDGKYDVTTTRRAGSGSVFSAAGSILWNFF